MGMYRNNPALEIYLRKHDSSARKPIRPMNSEDTRMLGEINDLHHEFNMLMTELFTVKGVLEALGDKRIAYVTRNLYRVLNSLRKHRDLVRIVRYAWMAVKPEEDEVRGVKTFLRQSRERIL